MNFGFKDKGKNILSIEINQNTLEEMRRERKIMMVLQDLNVDEYIKMDITEIDLYVDSNWKSLELPVQLAIMDKLDFREKLA